MTKFIFEFKIIDKDITINDQNVHSFRFVNIGETNAVINGQFILQAPQSANPNFIFDEDLKSGEKTGQGYKIKFANVSGKQNRIQIVMKIPLNE